MMPTPVSLKLQQRQIRTERGELHRLTYEKEACIVYADNQSGGRSLYNFKYQHL